MSKESQKIQVALADDHKLVRSSMARLVSSFPNCNVLFDVENGEEVMVKLQNHFIPDILLLDISMPIMDGYETCLWATKHYPQVRIIALTMNTDERSIVKMMRNGAKGFLSKNTEAAELKKAIETVVEKNFYLPEEMSIKLVTGMQNEASLPTQPSDLSEKEREFLILVCTEMHYEQIAKKMYISVRTVDDYRATLYEKLKVHSRMGMAMYAIKNGLVDSID
jgi:DNA-binding NarL/FixJ family response regulator